MTMNYPFIGYETRATSILDLFKDYHVSVSKIMTVLYPPCEKSIIITRVNTTIERGTLHVWILPARLLFTMALLFIHSSTQCNRCKDCCMVKILFGRTFLIRTPLQSRNHARILVLSSPTRPSIRTALLGMVGNTLLRPNPSSVGKLTPVKGDGPVPARGKCLVRRMRHGEPLPVQEGSMLS